MQAKNYAAQVVKSLDAFIPNYQKMLKANGDKYFGLEAAHLKTLQGVIKNAVHFTMPDGGLLLDDSLKGLKSSEIRLPFQSITIECFIPDDGSFNELTPNICEKRLIVATETNSDVMKHINDIVISNKEKLGGMGDLLAKGLDALNDDWVGKRHTDIVVLRERLGLTPNYKRNKPDLIKDQG